MVMPIDSGPVQACNITGDAHHSMQLQGGCYSVLELC